MKKRTSIILILLGVLWLLVDVKISTGLRYPEWKMLENYGTEIQRMVMGEVVGECVKPDVVSDIIGFILLAAGCAGFRKNSKRFRNAVILSGIGIVLYIFRMVMPFVLTGANLYGLSYATPFLVAAAEAMAVYLAVAGLIFLCEEVENHMICVPSEIFITIASVCGFIYGTAAFYQIHYVEWAYYVAQICFTALSMVLLLAARKYFNPDRIEKKQAAE